MTQKNSEAKASVGQRKLRVNVGLDNFDRRTEHISKGTDSGHPVVIGGGMVNGGDGVAEGSKQERQVTIAAADIQNAGFHAGFAEDVSGASGQQSVDMSGVGEGFVGVPLKRLRIAVAQRLEFQPEVPGQR